MPGILIDTNVLIYAVDPMDRERQDHAIQVLRLLDINREGRLSVQNLAEFYHVTTHSRKPFFTRQEALVQVDRLIQTFPVFQLTQLIVLEAGRGARDYMMAYYDAQIWASARLNGVITVFSEDFTHGQVLEGVRFVNPFERDFKLIEWE